MNIRWPPIVLAALCASACKQSEHRLELISAEAVMLELPVIEQDELFECGLVSITALCQYYDKPIPSDTRNELVAVAAEREGLSGAELQSALEGLGMEVLIFPGSLDDEVTGLYHHVDDGRPPIVMVSDDGERHHYCLFLGYDRPLGNVFLLDPARGRVCVPSAAFARDWERSNRFTLLSFPAAPAAAADPRPRTTEGLSSS
jgi:ABC-type bacteriocin/lantibiotic exporter with double-glycine peptidase domain